MDNSVQSVSVIDIEDVVHVSNKKIAPIYSHFINGDGVNIGKYVCKYCREAIAIPKSKASSNLHRHLQRCKKRSLDVDASCSRIIRSQTIEESIAFKEKDYPEINRRLVKFLVTDGRPFYLTEGDGFRDFMKFLIRGKYAPPSYATKMEIMNTYYSNARQQQMLLLNDSTSTTSILQLNVWTVIADGWTSLGSHSYIGVMMSSLDESFSIRSICIGLHHMRVKHNSANILHALQEYLLSAGFQYKQIFATVCDNGANMLKSMTDMQPVYAIRCGAHTLQLSIKSAFKKTAPAMSIISKFKRIVTYFKKSSSAYEELNDIQKELVLPDHALISDVCTR